MLPTYGAKQLSSNVRRNLTRFSVFQDCKTLVALDASTRLPGFNFGGSGDLDRGGRVGRRWCGWAAVGPEVLESGHSGLADGDSLRVCGGVPCAKTWCQSGNLASKR